MRLLCEVDFVHDRGLLVARVAQRMVPGLLGHSARVPLKEAILGKSVTTHRDTNLLLSVNYDGTALFLPTNVSRAVSHVLRAIDA